MPNLKRKNTIVINKKILFTDNTNQYKIHWKLKHSLFLKPISPLSPAHLRMKFHVICHSTRSFPFYGIDRGDPVVWASCYIVVFPQTSFAHFRISMGKKSKNTVQTVCWWGKCWIKP